MKKVFIFFFFLHFACLFTSCIRPFRSFAKTKAPAPPDYSNFYYWASLPDKKDSADIEMPAYGIIDGQKDARADVFYVHPTSYRRGTYWNAPLDKKTVIEFTNNLSCKLQASVFNGSCRVYMPRFRDAVLFTYFGDHKNRSKAFDLAYSDLRTAFLYYMKHYNNGRPIVIASHSQGTDHAIRLVQEFFDNDSLLNKQLVAAYLIGRPIYDTTFKKLKLADNENQTGGFVVWNSVRWGINSFYGEPLGKILCVNPLTWKSDTVYAPAKLNKGGLPFTFDKIEPEIADAKIAPSGFLWIHRPPGGRKKYPKTNTPYFHLVDYNLFYMNIRANVKNRIEQYYLQHPLANRTYTSKTP